MTYFEYDEKLRTLKYLAEHKQTGTPEDLAEKFGVSQRTVFRMVQQMRDHGYPIAYDRYRRTYEVNDCIKKNF